MATLNELEREINKIKSRNKKVEADKAWETSVTRKILIAVFTYLTIALYFGLVVKIDPWINAIVPTAGFLLSTLSLPFFKEIWRRYIYKG